MSLIKTIDATARPSERLLKACAAFGLAVRHTPTNPQAGRPTCDGLARDVLQALSERLVAAQSGRDGNVRKASNPRTSHISTLTLITGPSGSGKSTLLTALAAHARRNGHTLLHANTSPHDPQTPLIDLIDLPLPESLRTLAHAGLADATMLSRTSHQLSEGERFRLRLAQAMAATRTLASNPSSAGSSRPLAQAPGDPPPVTLVIDEFASVLDRTTARCLSHALRRWLSTASQGTSIHVLLATAHDDVQTWLAPDLTITFSHSREPVIQQAHQSQLPTQPHHAA